MPFVCVVAVAAFAVPVLLVPSKTLNCGTVVQDPPREEVITRLVKCPAATAIVCATTVFIADAPNKNGPAEIVPSTGVMVSVIVPEEFV